MRISGTLPVVWVVTGMPDKHAFLSPSSAERWYHCPPSAWLCEQFPDLGSVFASEGTEAHSLCEFLLRQKLGQAGLVDPRPSLQYYTSEMEECCQGYVQYVSEIVEDMRNRGSSPAVYVEQRVDLRRFIPESMGTSDCVIVGGDEICIVDFKYGMYPVPASSLQLRIYALGACEMLSALYDFDKVRMVVYQPRLSNVDDCSMSVVDLYAWASSELHDRAQAAFVGQGAYEVGEWCRNCRARRQCRALAEHQLEIARFDFSDPPLLSDEEISEVLSRVDGLIAWANGVREYALDRALAGKKIAGWKVVEGRCVRKFSDDDSVCARVTAAGYDPYEKKMLGVAGLEKLLGRKDFKNLLADLVIRQAGKPVLVPADDKRPEYVPAAVEFSESNEREDKQDE